ncbi:CopD family protein [Neisseria yangbaofengii]|uniref:CopD family protein n=1 Tax=Neisseria yangbaofengii TaxID=2709396 RepID=UPI0013EA56F2|nr:CopD family protein [Neisseria yangbaofengii]
MYLWLKLAHIFFIISWFAGLFYLPRIYVNLAQVNPQTGAAEYARLLGMAQRLYKFMSPLGILAVICGLAIPFATGWWPMGWVHGKVTLGILLIGYQHICRAHLRHFEQHTCRHSHKFYRVFNEVPVLLMILALYLVVFKPF